MRASKKLISKIKQFEGLRLCSYKCPAGVWTVGYGSTKGVVPNMRISQSIADARLLADINDVEEGLRKLKKLPPLTQGQWDALVDWCFNYGVHRLTHSDNDNNPTTLYKKIVTNAPTKDIQEQFRRWVYSNGKKLPGLVKRREWEAQRWAEKE